MGKRCLEKCFCACLILYILTGCRKGYENDVNVLALEPQAEMISVPTDFIINSIEAVGGLVNWGKIKQLELNCLVTYYQSNGSFYLTEQHYDIYPWSNGIQIFGEEPQGKYIWQLSQGKFNVLEDSEQIKNSIVNISNSCLAEAILNIITIPARFLDSTADFTRGNAPINIQGKSYYPITRQNRNINENSLQVSNAIFYQDTNNSLVDLICLVFQSEDVFFMVRGYDYKEIENRDIFIPSKIEIFKTDAQGILKNKLVTIDVNST